MERVFPWLAVVFASVIAIVAVFELDMRSDEGQQALPTMLPSPTDETTPGAQATPTQAPAVPTTPMGPPTPEPTTPAPTSTPAETEEPVPTATPKEPSPSIAPPVEDEEPMPNTGGGAVAGGTALVGLALGFRYVVRRSY